MTFIPRIVGSVRISRSILAAPQRPSSGDSMHKPLAAIALAISLPALPADGTASGTVVYQGKTVTIKHVWLVKGPDTFDPKATIRELVFSATDIGEKVRACKKMSCLGGNLDEGLTGDFDVGPRLNSCLLLERKEGQYWGTATPQTLKAKGQQSARRAGTSRHRHV